MLGCNWLKSMKNKKSPIHSDLSPVDLKVATLLAMIWVTVGLLAIVMGVIRGYWVAVLLGVLALLYGLMWVKVRLTGRRLKWPLHRR